MSDEQRPHFHSISALPAVAIHISAWLQEVLEPESGDFSAVRQWL